MFFESEFPTAIGFMASGGPSFFTTVNEGFSGYEQRNRNWANTRGMWTIDLQNKPQAYFDAVHAFFLVCGGQADAFRFKDHKDFIATGQVLGIGDGVTAVFQLVKNYASGGRTYTRTIMKPITSSVLDFEGNALADTVVVYLNGTSTGAYTLDYTTGQITLTSAPETGVVVSADCQFHYPVRFVSDEMKAQIEPSFVNAGMNGTPLFTWPNFELREVRL